MSGIRKRDLLRTAVRLAFYQSTWCNGGMQSIGLAYCLLPGFRSLSTSKDHLNELVKVCEEPFNTHPYLGGAVAGVVLQMAENGKSVSEIKGFLHGSMGILGALADPFLRGALPIFVTSISTLMAMHAGMIAGIVTLLVLFNSVHLVIRLGGFALGYREGIGVLQRMGRFLSHSRTNALKHVSAFGIGAVLIESARVFAPAEPTWGVLAMAAGGLVAALGLIKWRPRRIYFVPIVMIVCLLAEVLI